MRTITELREFVSKILPPPYYVWGISNHTVRLSANKFYNGFIDITMHKHDHFIITGVFPKQYPKTNCYSKMVLEQEIERVITLDRMNLL